MGAADGTCGCGCGSPTPRRFRPGHDAKLKGALSAQTRDPRWWVRERAVKLMVEGGWGRWVDRAILATTPMRSRFKGRHAQTRHIDSLHGCVLDDAGTSHSVWFCPAASSRGRWVKGAPTGWVCSTCIHLKDYAEIVADPGYGIRQDAPMFLPAPAPKPAPKRPRSTTSAPDADWAELMADAAAELDRAA